MAPKGIEELVETLVQEIIQEKPLDLIDVEFVHEKDWYLRIFLDKPGGLEVDDCQWVSEQLEQKLDQLDPIPQSYYLEVSSPGLDRPLKKEKELCRYIGDNLDISLFAPLNGKKQVTAELLSLDKENLHVDLDGVETAIPRDRIALIKLHLNF